MQHADKFRLFLGIVMTLFAVYFVAGLFPFVRRRQQSWEGRLKPSSRVVIRISAPRRVVAGLFFGLLAAQIFAAAFHRELSVVTGVSSKMLFWIMFLILPSLLVLFTIWDTINSKARVP